MTKRTFLTFLLVCSALVLSHADHRIPPKYRAIIEEECRPFVIPTTLVYHLVVSESQWKENAFRTNSNGTYDVGLFQINSSCFAEFSWRFFPGQKFDPYNYEDNIRCGIRYLARLYRIFWNWEDTITAYKAGPTRLLRGHSLPETRALAQRILEAYRADRAAFSRANE